MDAAHEPNVDVPSWFAPRTRSREWRSSLKDAIIRVHLKAERADDVDVPCRVLLTEFLALLERVWARKPRRAFEIVALIDGGIDATIAKKDTAEARELFQKAYAAFAMSAGTGNQAWFFAGAIIGALLMLALTVCVILASKIPSVGHLFEGLAVEPVVVGLTFYAVAGSLTSVLMRLRKMDLSEEDDRPLVLMTGALTPVVAMGFMSVTYVILSSHLVPLDHTGNDGHAAYAVYYVAAFLCGFSEQFAPSLLDRVGIQIGDKKER